MKKLVNKAKNHRVATYIVSLLFSFSLYVYLKTKEIKGPGVVIEKIK